MKATHAGHESAPPLAVLQTTNPTEGVLGFLVPCPPGTAAAEARAVCQRHMLQGMCSLGYIVGANTVLTKG